MDWHEALMAEWREKTLKQAPGGFEPRLSGGYGCLTSAPLGRFDDLSADGRVF